MSAEVQISLRSSSMSGPSSRSQPIPLDTFTANKDMGQILLRRSGETIAAGMLSTSFCIMFAQHGFDRRRSSRTKSLILVNIYGILLVCLRCNAICNFYSQILDLSK